MTRETCGRDHVDVLRSEVAALKAEVVWLRAVLAVKNQALQTFAECWNEHAIPTPEAFRRAAEAMNEEEAKDANDDLHSS